MMRKIIVITNDFPPRQGGIQSFVYSLVQRFPSDSVLVYASDFPGAHEFDAAQGFPVVRHGSPLLIPTPGARTRIQAVARDFGATAAWFGAAAPLALLAPSLRAVGVQRIVATTHGHEVGWALLPGARQLLRRIGDNCDIVTYLGEYTRRRLAPALGPRCTVRQLAPGVDTQVFKPDLDTSALRERYHLGDAPVVVCVSRLVERKGQDRLIEVLPELTQRIPGVRLVLVGTGPYSDSLRSLAQRLGCADSVVFTGSVAEAELPQHYALGDVFAMPCRTRRFGMDVEGLGIVYLEASATGTAVIAGDSGGAPDAVRAGETGYVVGGSDKSALVGRLVELLSNRERAHQMGIAGREWVERDWQWDSAAEALYTMLQS